VIPVVSVTDEKSLAARLPLFIKLDVPVKALCLEPLRTELSFPLRGIHWLMLGGETGPAACPFRPRWAYDLQERCLGQGVPFFLKQLGSNVQGATSRMPFRDRNGADATEWPINLRSREVPTFFSQYHQLASVGTSYQ
jgi:protein gp37